MEVRGWLIAATTNDYRYISKLISKVDVNLLDEEYIKKIKASLFRGINKRGI